MAIGQVITNNGIIMVYHRALDPSNPYSIPNQMVYGSGSTTPTVSDTALTTPMTLQNGSAVAYTSQGGKLFDTGFPSFTDGTMNIQFQNTILVTDEVGGSQNFTISEIGVCNSDATPVLFSHATITPVSHTASLQVTFSEVDYFAQ